jgi:metal-sulfur cluster biosynthetic enzyme
MRSSPEGTQDEAMSDHSAESPTAPVAAQDVDDAAVESEIREALRQVVDPEINIDIVTLGLIREIVRDGAGTEVRMILTTPFCPYAGTLVQQTKDMTRAVTGGEVRVVLLDEPVWSPELMEGGDWSEWGLI